MRQEARVLRPGARQPGQAWSLRPWPNRPEIAHLVFNDQRVVPTIDDCEHIVATARASGAHAVRTSAMFPDAARVAAAFGFVTIDELVLLRLVLDPHHHLPPPTAQVRPMRPWHTGQVVRIDREAFGDEWANTAASLKEIRHATPDSKASLITRDRRPVGFAITGRGGEFGYLQRLAVSRSHQRQGVARNLVSDALEWVRQPTAATTVLVNTGVTNRAALELYHSFGFGPTGELLTIAEFMIADP